MMLQWSSEFDAASVTWLCLAAVGILVFLLPGFILLLTSLRQTGGSETEQATTDQLLLAAIGTLAWVLGQYSFAFGPSVGTSGTAQTAAGEVSFQAMMSAAEKVDDQSQRIGRGGWIGNAEFALFGSLTPGGNPSEPVFTSRRPHHRVPHSAYMFFQLTVFLVAIGAIGRLTLPYLSRPAGLCGSLLWGAVVYCPMAHWVWGDGWLAVRGAVDFGGGLLHLTLGCSALALCLMRQLSPIAAGTLPESSAAISRWPESTFLIAVLLCCSGSLLLNSTLTLSGTALRAAAMLNSQIGTAAACVGWCLLRQLKGQPVTIRDVTCGAIVGIAAMGGGSGLFLPQSAMLVGAFSGLAACATCCVRNSSNGPSQTWTVFSIQAVPAAIGLLATGLLAASSVGAKRWDGSIIASLADGDTRLIGSQLLSVAAIAGLSMIGTTVCFRPLIRRGP